MEVFFFVNLENSIEGGIEAIDDQGSDEQYILPLISIQP